MAVDHTGFRKVNQLVNGMYVRLVWSHRPGHEAIVWEGSMSYQGHDAVGLVTDHNSQPDIYARVGPVGPVYRDCTSYGGGNHQWYELIMDKEYDLDQELDAEEDLL